MSNLFLVALLMLVSLGTAAAQSNVSHGEIRGFITDPSGAVIQGAQLTITNVDAGISRTASTDTQGGYRFLLVQPGTYAVQATYTGFQTQLRSGLEVTVGQTAVVDFSLQVDALRGSLTVVDESPEIDYVKVQQSNTIDTRTIRNLPIDRRTYLTFTLLAPGVADSNALADNTDFRAIQAAHSGLSFYGSNGRGNSITVDGAEANDTFGGVRPTLSQEAVQEFQINRSNYSAELGGASGGVINIVSRSGGNMVSGSAFGFFRDDVFDAADPFAIALVGNTVQRIKPPSDRQQYGGTIGFPIRRNKTFFFGSYEGLNRDESSAVPVLTDFSIFDPTAAQRSIIQSLAANPSTTPVPCISLPEGPASLPPAQCATALQSALTSTNSTRDLFRQNSGVFPFLSNTNAFSVRLDHLPNERNPLFFRYNYSLLAEDNQNTRALVGFTRSNNVDTLDSTTAGGWTHIFGPNVLNELRLQWNYRRYAVIPNEQYGPELNVTGFGFFNRDITLPSRTFERRYEIADNLTRATNAHRVKLGGVLLIRSTTSENHTFLGGRFSFGALPGGLVSPQLGVTPITSVQAFDLGLPQLYQVGFGDPAISSTKPFAGVYIQDSWNPIRGLTIDYGARYELDVRRSPLPTDKNNFAPRVGFAWDPFNTKRSVVRGGYGIFYAPIYYQIDWVVNALNEINGYRQIAQVLTTFNGADPYGVAGPVNIFRTLRASGVVGIPTSNRSVTPDDLKQFGIQVTHNPPRPPLTVLFRNDPKYHNTYSQQASLGIEHQIGPDWSVAANYIFASTLGIPRSRDVNILPRPIGPAGIRDWSAAAGCTGAALASCFRDPSLLQENVYEPSARAFYHGMILEIQKRFSRKFSITGNYTLSKAIDEVTDFNSDFQPNDQTNLRAERALSAFDQRHKVVLYAYLEGPRGGESWWQKVISNFDLTPTLRGNSARPFNLLTGTDLNGDRHATTDRPALAGRNTGIGPNFWSVDFRLTRRVSIGSERRRLELMLEAFNLLNRPNYASVNNTVGPNFAPPYRVEARKDLNPSQPLAYTSVTDPRRLQLGVRLSF